MSQKDKERKKATIQDDSREAQIALHCGLQQVIGRGGVDAKDKNGNPYEQDGSTSELWGASPKAASLRSPIRKLRVDPTKAPESQNSFRSENSGS